MHVAWRCRASSCVLPPAPWGGGREAGASHKLRKPYTLSDLPPPANEDEQKPRHETARRFDATRRAQCHSVHAFHWSWGEENIAFRSGLASDCCKARNSSRPAQLARGVSPVDQLPRRARRIDDCGGIEPAISSAWVRHALSGRGLPCPSARSWRRQRHSRGGQERGELGGWGWGGGGVQVVACLALALALVLPRAPPKTSRTMAQPQPSSDTHS